MKLSNAMTTAVMYEKSHRLVLIGMVMFVAFGSVFSWFYVSAARQQAQSVPTQSLQNLQSVLKPLQAQINTPIDTTIQSVTQSDGAGLTRTTVQVGEQQIQAPQTGSLHQVIQDPNGTTTVDISASNNSSGTSSASSATNVNLHSESSTVIRDSQQSGQ